MRWQWLLAATLSLICGCERGRAAATTTTTTDPASALAGGLVARVHFVGSDQIGASPNATNLNAIAALPETAALRAFIKQYATEPVDAA